MQDPQVRPLVRLRRETFLKTVGLLTLAVAVYLPAVKAGYIWDDAAHVAADERLESLEGLVQIWTDPTSSQQYYPLTHTSFWLEFRLWGYRPAGYHLDNILLHALSGILFWRILVRLGVPGAWLAAALFVVHPVHVESVAWVSERKNCLSTALYLGAALSYFRFTGLPDKEVSRLNWNLYAGAFLLFVGALMSKTVTATLPAALLLAIWWKRGALTKKDWGLLTPFFVAGIGLGLYTAWFERSNVIGHSASEFGFSIVDRILIAGRAVWFYAGKLAWPSPLNFNYPRWNIDATVWWQYAFPLAAAGLVGILVAFRTQLGRGPLVAVLFFGGTLFPALGFIDVYPFRFSFVADHFQYLASLGLITLAAVIATTLLDRYAKPLVRQATVGACLLLLATLTWSHATVFKNESTLWNDVLQKNDQSFLAHVQLAAVESRRGNPDHVLTHLRTANRLQPGDPDIEKDLGSHLIQAGQPAEAVTLLSAGLAKYPNSAWGHYLLALAYQQSGQLSQAIDLYQKTLKLAEDDPSIRADSLNNLAWILATAYDAQLRDGPRAVQLAEEANAMVRRQSPDYLDVLAASYAQAGRYREAIETADEALKIAREQGRFGLEDDLAIRIQIYRDGRPMIESPPDL